MIKVKVGVFPGQVREALVHEGATVHEALNAGGVDVAGLTTVNGQEVRDMSQPVNAGDRIVVSVNVKGN